jgi:regulator of nucleoside diphosphate kinase|tara:strand:- start:116677 stop:116958 length:282 start_codon:yes stop_codon:yes gene_type:complete
VPVLEAPGGTQGKQFYATKRVNMNTRPKIVISSLDADRLDTLLGSVPDGTFPGKAELEAELARAEIVEPKKIPSTVVSMNSTVRFRVESSQEA